MRVLLVEDDHRVGELVHDELEREGADCDWAKTSAEAHALLRLDGDDAYNWLVADYGLPDGDGLEIIDRYTGRARTVLFSGTFSNERNLPTTYTRRRPDHVIPKEQMPELLRLLETPVEAEASPA